MIEYIPIIRENPKALNCCMWGDISTILKDIIIRFNLKTNSALEFGVHWGGSISALSNYFKSVIGIDNFELARDFTDSVCEKKKIDCLKLLRDNGFLNIELIRSDYKDYIKKETRQFDLIHLDMYHLYPEVYECGSWAVSHSDCVIVHDTLSYPETMKACKDITKENRLTFYNYPYSDGLGILTKKTVSNDLTGKTL
jgi:predicted O-methyltransferase YrrM